MREESPSALYLWRMPGFLATPPMWFFFLLPPLPPGMNGCDCWLLSCMIQGCRRWSTCLPSTDRC